MRLAIYCRNYRYIVAERMGTIIVSAIVAHTAWHWMIERFDLLHKFPWPAITYGDLAQGLSWLIVAVSVAAVMWLVSIITQRRKTPAPSDMTTEGGAAKDRYRCGSSQRFTENETASPRRMCWYTSCPSTVLLLGQIAAGGATIKGGDWAAK